MTGSRYLSKPAEAWRRLARLSQRALCHLRLLVGAKKIRSRPVESIQPFWLIDKPLRWSRQAMSYVVQGPRNPVREGRVVRSVQKVRYWCVVFLFVVAAPALAAGVPTANQPGSEKEIVVEVDVDTIVRHDVPATLFGFNIMWDAFQAGYFRGGAVRKEVIEWLKPFHGAVYRYGGNTFEWRKSVGPLEGRRPHVMKWDNKPRVTEFGFDEYIEFVRQVGGVPLVIANLFGRRKDPWSEEFLKRYNQDWVRYANKRGRGERLAPSRPGEPCDTTRPCSVLWWELGNELDHVRGWDAQRYVARAGAVGRAMREVDSGIELIALTRTAPWNSKWKKEISSSAFNQAVLRGLSDTANGAAFHLYYDGLPVPHMLRYLERVNRDAKKVNTNENIKLFVTEHGRWPSKRSGEDWKKNWHHTGNLGGALSTADFLLAAAEMPNVKAAVWHALGTQGPWQLFYSHTETQELYPNVVYWALRVLKAGLFDNIFQTEIISEDKARYGGGYDTRVVVSGTGKLDYFSLLTVNRAGANKTLKLSVPQLADKNFKITRRYVNGDTPKVGNKDSNMNKISMQTELREVHFDSKGYAHVTIPSYSVVSDIFEKKS